MAGLECLLAPFLCQFDGIIRDAAEEVAVDVCLRLPVSDKDYSFRLHGTKIRNYSNKIKEDTP